MTPSASERGPVQIAIRQNVGTDQTLRTPARKARFRVGKISDEQIVLLLGKGEWATPISWECLEGIPEFLAGRGEIPIGGAYDVSGREGTLDGYLKRFLSRATAAWVAAVLEQAGIIDIVGSHPVRIRIRVQIPT